MDILVVGSGGREHALVWKLRQSNQVNQIYVAPGNAGTAKMTKNIMASTTPEIVDWLKENKIDLVVIGSDSHLAEGIVDILSSLKIPTFGPTKAAAEIEWSKSYAKQLMKEEGIPTADYQTFDSVDEAKEYLKGKAFPLVIKASGLALGKGVVITKDLVEAEKVLDGMMSEKVFGAAGEQVIIEEYMQGREISIHAFCDGDNFQLFPAAQDHKRIFDGDTGPNTGGMGTIAPVPWVSSEMMQTIANNIVSPTLKALKRRGRPFRGVLFPGIMVTESGPKVIEFNARFGDPETQSYMRILETDLVDIMIACLEEKIKDQKIEWLDKSACCIVVASEGYPGPYNKGFEIKGLDTVYDEQTVLFQAGTKYEKDMVTTNGGRVLGVTSLGDNLELAITNAYKSVAKVSFSGMYYRRDIGFKSL